MPIQASAIEKILLETGFIPEIEKETKKKKPFYSKEIDQYVYINKTSGESNSTLIINPEFKTKRQEFLLLKGVNSNDIFYHSSNMKEFPKKINKGENPIPYGIPFGFESLTACRDFLLKLTGKNIDEDEDELDDIKDAEKSLSGLSDTERTAIIKSRIGQGLYRELLIQKWNGCSITGLQFLPVLRASHIKPWKVSSNLERLDPFNGLLLTPGLDAVFDRGFISFLDEGSIVISSKIPSEAQENLGVTPLLKLKMVKDEHIKYLDYHRNHIFKR